MERLVLRQDINEIIRKDAMLYGKVATALNIVPMSMSRILTANSLRLTEASVLKVIREHLNIKEDSELLTPEMEAA